jgi:TPR repeat protein
VKSSLPVSRVLVWSVYLQKGKCVSTDFKLAAQYLKLAADQGIASAQNNYAACLQKGEGRRSKS